MTHSYTHTLFVLPSRDWKLTDMKQQHLSSVLLQGQRCVYVCPWASKPQYVSTPILLFFVGIYCVCASEWKLTASADSGPSVLKWPVILDWLPLSWYVLKCVCVYISVCGVRSCNPAGRGKCYVVILQHGSKSRHAGNKPDPDLEFTPETSRLTEPHMRTSETHTHTHIHLSTWRQEIICPHRTVEGRTAPWKNRKRSRFAKSSGACLHGV